MEFNGNDVALGNCKAIGEARSNEEAYLVLNLRVDADLVREKGVGGLLEEGIITKNDNGTLSVAEEVREEVREEVKIDEQTVTATAKKK